MLFLVGAWTVLLAVSVPVGAAVLRWTTGPVADPPATDFDRHGDRFILSAWLGLLMLGSALLAVSLLFPLTPVAGAVAGFGAVTGALSSSAVRAEINSFRVLVSGRLALASILLAAGVGIATAQPVTWRDTGIYHAGVIRWLSEHGAVKGVAHVQDGLGNGSSWLALAAPFNLDGIREHALVVMGGLAVLLLVLHALICLSRVLRRAARTADWILIAGSALLIPTIMALQKVHVSASPDLPVMIVGLLVGWAIFALAGTPPERTSATPGLSPGPAAIPLLLSLGAMAVKPHAAPLVAVAAAFFIWTGERRLKRAAWTVLLGIALVVPWLGFQFVTTGCPAYSLPVCADVSWSVGAEEARATSERLHIGARRGAGESGLGWVGPWLADDLSPALGALAVASVLMLLAAAIAAWRAPPASRRRDAATWIGFLGALGLFAFLLRAEEIFMVTLACVSLVWLGGRRQPGTGWLLVLGVAGVAATVYGAPHPRFAFGYMAVLVGRLSVVHGSRIWAWTRSHLNPPARIPSLGLTTLLLATAAAVVVGTLLRPTTTRSAAFEPQTFVLPPAMTASTTIEPGVPSYRVAPDGLCWAAELPCIAAYPGLDPGVTLHDPSRGVGGGFRRSAE